MRVKFTPDTDDAESYGDLTPGNVYRVITLQPDDIRIMSDEGVPYCYPLSMFTIVDATWPGDWVAWHDRDGERYASPKVFTETGFWERFFDGDKEARLQFKVRLQKWRNGED